jgi:small-conductance mechanosensitive channel
VFEKSNTVFEAESGGRKMSEKGQSGRYLLPALLAAGTVSLFYLLETWYPGSVSSLSLDLSFSYKVKIIWSVISFVGVALFIELIRKSYLYYITDLQTRHKVRRSLQWIRIFLIAVAFFVIWGEGFKNYGVIFGLVGAGLALSLQELILSIVGWGFIMLTRPFDIGDRIEIDNQKGDVIDISVLHTTLVEVGNWVDAEQSTGRLLMIPNGSFIRHSSTNYTKGFSFIWNELVIVVTFESDWEKAKEIILSLSTEEDAKFKSEIDKQIKATQETYAIRFGMISSIVYTSIQDSGVALTLRYLSPVRSRRSTSHKLYEAILKAFSTEPDIDFAYPTTRFYKSPVDLVQLNAPGESSKG